MHKLLHNYSPAMAEAILGDYAAQSSAHKGLRLSDGEQIGQVLQYGMDAVEHIATEYYLSKPERLQLEHHLGQLGTYAEARLHDPKRAAALQAKAAAIELYNSTFRDAVHQKLAEGTYERTGRYSNVHMIELGGKAYAVRKVHGQSAALHTNVKEVDKHAEAAIRLQSPPPITEFEEVKAISYTDEVTVAPRIFGQRFRTAAAKGELDEMTEDSVATMYDAMKRAEQRGVAFDGSGPNLLLTPTGDLRWVDMGVARKNKFHGSPPEQAIASELIRSYSRVNDAPTLFALARVAEICMQLSAGFTTNPHQYSHLQMVHSIILQQATTQKG